MKKEEMKNIYTDLWVRTKWDIQGSEYCKAIREENSTPAFSTAICQKCMDKKCKFFNICLELYKMNQEDHEEEKLKELEESFLENGYTKEQIEEIKHAYGDTDKKEFINNLEEEQSCWSD